MENNSFFTEDELNEFNEKGKVIGLISYLKMSKKEGLDRVVCVFDSDYQLQCVCCTSRAKERECLEYIAAKSGFNAMIRDIDSCIDSFNDKFELN